jgi:flagellar hook-basal body complex protein FliE
MSPVSAVTSPIASLYARIAGTDKAPPVLPDSLRPAPTTTAPAGTGFANVFDQLVGAVESKQVQSDTVTRNVLIGDKAPLHQSVIAMQEASVAFSLMVEVRNKLVESYQELMRMPV